MAYFKISQNKKGQLQAKIQVSGKDLSTGKSKVFTKRVYNTDKLTEAKFRRQVDKIAIAFEEEVLQAYEEGKTSLRSKVLISFILPKRCMEIWGCLSRET